MIKVTVHLRDGLTLVEKLEVTKEEMEGVLYEGFKNLTYLRLNGTFLNPAHVISLKIEEAE